VDSYTFRSAILSMILVGMVGCTSSEDSTTSSAPLPVAGMVTLDLSGVAGANGLVMLSLIGKNLPHQPMAAACGLVDSDSFGFSGEYLPIIGPDPCTLGADPVTFDPGTYDIVVAVMLGGSTSPDQCAETEVAVDGDVTIELAGLGPPTDCDF